MSSGILGLLLLLLSSTQSTKHITIVIFVLLYFACLFLALIRVLSMVKDTALNSGPCLRIKLTKGN